MVNQIHLDVLSQGVEVWNEWKRKYHILPDLRNAYLSGIDLRYADLKYADLRRADLRNANLFEADLSQANLSQANLKFLRQILVEPTLAKRV